MQLQSLENYQTEKVVIFDRVPLTLLRFTFFLTARRFKRSFEFEVNNVDVIFFWLERRWSLAKRCRWTGGSVNR